jgi:hypothetical protein
MRINGSEQGLEWTHKWRRDFWLPERQLQASQEQLCFMESVKTVSQFTTSMPVPKIAVKSLVFGRSQVRFSFRIPNVLSSSVVLLCPRKILGPSPSSTLQFIIQRRHAFQHRITTVAETSSLNMSLPRCQPIICIDGKPLIVLYANVGCGRETGDYKNNNN